MNEPMSFEEVSDVLNALAAAICYAMPNEQRSNVHRLLAAFAENHRQDGEQKQAVLLRAMAAAISRTPPPQTH